MQLLIKNGMILQQDGTFLKGHIGINNGKIAALWYGSVPALGESVAQINAQELLVSPGFIDTHVHGGNTFSFNFCGDISGWQKMQERLSSIGITSILATGTSLPINETFNFIDRIKNLAGQNDVNHVEILGIYMEGPYININKMGAHREEYIRPACKDEIGQILERANGLIKVLALAPEIEENLAVIKTLTAAGISVSFAHTDAGYDAALAGFAAGGNRVTHTFNGMPALSHRYEGIVSAAWQYGAFLELIADGFHLSPTVMKMLISATDPGKIVLVSDNNEFAGLPDGSYTQGDRKLIVSQGQIRTEAGRLAGSAAKLNKCALNVTYCGFSAGSALKMAAENPARSIGVFDRKGSIAFGKDADIVILDGQFDVMMTIKSGQIVYSSDRFPSYFS